MADVTGTLHHGFGDKTYALRLTLGGLAKLQGRHGLDLGGLLSGKFDTKEAVASEDGGEAGDTEPPVPITPVPIPPFAIMIDVVAVALEKGESMDHEQATDLADDMLTRDRGLCGAVMQAAFLTPAEPGNGKAPRSKR